VTDGSTDVGDGLGGADAGPDPDWFAAVDQAAVGVGAGAKGKALPGCVDSPAADAPLLSDLRGARASPRLARVDVLVPWSRGRRAECKGSGCRKTS
jgi:hypothetical protein